MSDYYEAEIEPIIGMDDKPNKKIYKVKMKCRNCNHLDYLFTCPKCGSTMYKCKKIF